MSMICSKCNKRPAVIFISKIEGNDKINEGYCIPCAKELGIGPVNDILNNLGISEEEMETMNQQIVEMYDQMEEGDEDFIPGGAKTFPFLDKLFGKKDENGVITPISKDESEPKKQSDKEQKKRKADNDAKNKKSFLENYCTNLTQRCREGKMDSIFGRDEEIFRVLQILNRRTKNNPCLIGEPGVGKTAVAEGIAQRIAENNVPSKLARKELYMLDLTALVAGTQFRGQFESRVKGLVEEIKDRGNVILFIDEVHNLVGTGDAEGSMNAANILKPALSRGEVQVIGATTFNEYRKHIEKDAALERRFQPVMVNEPTIEDAKEMLLGIKKYYEEYHDVKISDEIVMSAVVLSERYITDRYLPDKAIDLIDEAASYSNLSHEDLAELYLNRVILERLKEQLEEEEAQVEEVDFEKLATLKSNILKVEQDIGELEEKVSTIQVTKQDLARVIELWTGIPASKVEMSSYTKVRGLSEKINEKVIGQEKAVDLVANAIMRTSAGVTPRRRPASFIFVGPTGVGKTELAKVLAAELFDGVEPLIRLDMSEYMERHSVSKIIGSPPGYIGYDEAGQLTEKIRRRPYSVILFDEIEKAHPDVLNILLAILDEGRVTDNKGRKVNFENCVVIMTSNAGSDKRESGFGFAKSTEDISREKVTKALREFLRPEFLGRVDEVVVFNPLTFDNLCEIAKLMLDEYTESLLEKGIKYTFDDLAAKAIVSGIESKASAARELRAVIRREVEDKIARAIVENDGIMLSKVEVSANDDKIIVDIS